MLFFKHFNIILTHERHLLVCALILTKQKLVIIL